MGAAQIEAFLTHLAIARKVSASTQNQALSALLFLYREVLERKLPWMDRIVPARTPKKLPVILTCDEVARLLVQMKGTPQLMARVLYGTGIRLMACMRLRVKDIDFDRNEIVVRAGKGNKDRVTMLPVSLCLALHEQLQRVKALHAQDLASGFDTVELPLSAARKFPAAGQEWGWQFVFPAAAIRTTVQCDAVTPMKRRFSATCATPCAWQALTSPPRHTRCAMPLPRICLKAASIFAPCRNCWGTRTWRPH